MDKDGSRLIRTAITNEKGKFSAIIPRGKYQVFVSHTGYEQSTPIVLDTKDPLNLVARKIYIIRRSDNH
jgi:hypothetical protein